MLNKNEARQIIRKRLNKLSNEQVETLSEEVILNCNQLDSFKKSKIIAIFISMSKEVQTHDFIEYMFSQGKHIVLPSVSGDQMVMREIPSISFEEERHQGVIQPSSIYKEINPLEIDLIFIPCLGFDLQKNRLGRGGGFYDKYLKTTKAQKILIAFEQQKMESFETETHDVSVDCVITEKSNY